MLLLIPRAAFQDSKKITSAPQTHFSIGCNASRIPRGRTETLVLAFLFADFAVHVLPVTEPMDPFAARSR